MLQPGNLVARKFLKNQALAESFWILLPHFITTEQFCGNRKEIILVFLENGHIFYNFQQKLSFCLVFHSLCHRKVPICFTLLFRVFPKVSASSNSNSKVAVALGHLW